MLPMEEEGIFGEAKQELVSTSMAWCYVYIPLVILTVGEKYTCRLCANILTGMDLKIWTNARTESN